jgi:hypothetical protein
MKKNPLIDVCIIAVVLLILGSLSNVVGYQSVQSSKQQIINEEVNQRELLFQTICDIANNKEIQRIILKSQMMNGKFLNSDMTPTTKQQLKQIYFIGLILSKVISKSKIHSMVQKYQLQNPITQEGINGVIEKDVTLRNEITQLQNSKCDCENNGTTGLWHFPVICTILFVIGTIAGFFMMLFALILDAYVLANIFYYIWGISLTIAYTIDCYFS